MNEQQVRPRSPLEMFFSLGDKVTGGDPQKKLTFDYMMMWIIFLAFFIVAASNFFKFFTTWYFAYLGWGLFGLAIMWFQYFGLKNIYQMREYQKKIIQEQKNPVKEEIEPADEMLKKFAK